MYMCRCDGREVRSGFTVRNNDRLYKAGGNSGNKIRKQIRNEYIGYSVC